MIARRALALLIHAPTPPRRNVFSPGLDAPAPRPIAVSIAAVHFVDDAVVESALGQRILQLPGMDKPAVAGKRYPLIEHFPASGAGQDVPMAPLRTVVEYSAAISLLDCGTAMPFERHTRYGLRRRQTQHCPAVARHEHAHALGLPIGVY